MNEFVTKVAAELADDFNEIQKWRSDEQLSAFVAGQHDTTPRQWQQVVLEIQIAIDAIEEAEINLRQIDRKIKKLRNGSDEEKDEGGRMMIGQRATRRAMLGKIREVETLYALYKSMPRFTREKIEAAEPDYWAGNRIPRQALHGLISRATGIPIGDLDAAVQLGIPVEKFVEQVIEKAKPCLLLMTKALTQPGSSGTLPAPSPDTSPADAST